MPKTFVWPAYVVLAAGVLLRLGLTVATPPERAYDDHYQPVEIMLSQGRLPDATDCWECYQPPLYYLVSAGFCAANQKLATWLDGPASDAEHIARQTLQVVSLLAGCATLWVCLAILRRFPELAPYQALGLALVAFLPRHIYMSAMATNDAFTYLVASAAIYAALWAHAAGWPTRRCLIAGALAGAAVLSKGYGWMTVATIVLSVWLFTHKQARGPMPGVSRPLLLVLAAAAALAIWPTVRNLWTYDQFHVDNYEMRDSPMRFQPPGSVGEISFTSFRFFTLLQKPWLHTAHADSFWTQLYARLWFDYEGFKTTLAPYPPWGRLWERCADAYPIWSRPRWNMLLDYAPEEVPASFRPIATAAYIAGLPLTLGVLAGCIVGLRRGRRDFAVVLLVLHFTLALCVPLFQTLRLPHFAAMKTAFALSSLTTAAVAVAMLLNFIPQRGLRLALNAALWLAAGVVAASDAAFVLLQLGQTWPTPA